MLESTDVDFEETPQPSLLFENKLKKCKCQNRRTTYSSRIAKHKGLVIQRRLTRWLVVSQHAKVPVVMVD